jgi:spore germination protein KB
VGGVGCLLASKDKISVRQAAIAFLVMIYSPAIRIYPPYVADQARFAGWLAPLFAVLPFIGLVFLMQALFQNCKDANLSDLILKIFGKYLGRTILSLYLVWLIILSGSHVRFFAERFLSALFPNTSVSFFSVSILIVAYYVVRGGIVQLIRTVEFLFLLFSAVFVLLFLLTIPNIELTNVLPVTYYDIIPLTKASFPIIGIWSYFTVIFFFGDKINDKENIRRFGFQSSIYLVITTLMLLIQTIGVYGYTVVKRLPFPYFIAVRSISLLDTIERIESVALAFWVIVDFVVITVFLYTSMSVIKSLFSLSERKHMASPVAILVFVFAYYIGKDRVELHAFTNYIGLPINILLFIVFPFILLLVGKLRKMI